MMTFVLIATYAKALHFAAILLSGRGPYALVHSQKGGFWAAPKMLGLTEKLIGPIP